MSIQLRDYQVNLTNNIYNLWQSGFKNVLAVSPTGSGKAFTLCNLAKDLVFKHGRPTVILVHRKELVSQLCMSLATLEVPHNIIAQKGTVLDIVNEQKRMRGKSYYNHGSQVTVVSVDTLLSREAKYRSWAAQQKVWILDEAAHLLKANKWGKTIDLFGSDVLGVGFTATPQRLDKKGLGSHAFGMFDVMTEGPTVKWLIENGFLSKYKIVEPKSDYRDHLVDNGSSTTDYTLKARENASLKSHLVGDIVTNYMKFADGMQTIVFADSIMAGSRIEEEFKRSGIKAKLLHGNTPSGERSLGVREFAENKIQVLVNVDLFGEGFDVYPLPGRRIVECVIMARPTKSLGLALQMQGRALRPHKDKPHAIIIDHVGNRKFHGLPDRVHKWTLDNIVKKRDSTSLHKVCGNVECCLPYDRWLSECPYCGYVEPKFNRTRDVTAREALKVVDGDMELLDPETIRELENEMNLESPDDVARRVGFAAGEIAAKSAHKKQRERIEAQKDLAETIALWAGREKLKGYTDRQIRKRFMIEFGEGITVMLSMPRKDMIEFGELIKKGI